MRFDTQTLTNAAFSDAFQFEIARAQIRHFEQNVRPELTFFGQAYYFQMAV
jgi:hypothetical protein